MEKEERMSDAYPSVDKCVIFHHKYFAITGDSIRNAIILERILYWFTPSKATGKLKVTIFRYGHFWVAKTRQELGAEVCVEPQAVSRALNALKKLGFIVVEIHKFQGIPTTFIRPIPEKINEALKKWEDEQAKVTMKAEEDTKSEIMKRQNSLYQNDTDNSYQNDSIGTYQNDKNYIQEITEQVNTQENTRLLSSDESSEPSPCEKRKYGEFENVLLTDKEYEKLQEEFPTDYQDRIDALSEYIASKNKKYKNHYATIKSWARMDKKHEKPSPTLNVENDDWKLIPY